MDFLTQLRNANIERQKEWIGDEEEPGMLFRTCEFLGEAGELANKIKKNERAKLKFKGSTVKRSEIEEEFADCLITLDLLANLCNINWEDVVKVKFNTTSKTLGFKTRVGE